MSRTIRTIARAAVVGLGVRALLAVVLQGSLAAAAGRLSAEAMADRLLQDSIPVLLAAGLWLAAPLWASWIESRAPVHTLGMPLSWPAALTIVGTALVVVPLASLAATWAILVAKMVLSQTWYEAERLVSPEYYSSLVTAIGPTFLAGAVLLTLARHVPEE